MPENGNEFLLLVFDDIYEKPGAAAVEFRFDKRKVWIPGSVFQNLDEDEKTVEVKAWLVEKEGLEAFVDD